jgi:hypothetical protein
MAYSEHDWTGLLIEVLGYDYEYERRLGVEKVWTGERGIESYHFIRGSLVHELDTK